MALPKSKPVFQCQGDKCTCINFSKSAFYVQGSSAFRLAPLPPSLKSLQVSRSHWHLPDPWETKAWYNWPTKGALLEKIVEQREMALEQREPSLLEIFHVKLDPWLLRRLKKLQISRELWFYILPKLGKKRPRTLVNHFKVFICCKKKPIP